jgi:hypothetical protein
MVVLIGVLVLLFVVAVLVSESGPARRRRARRVNDAVHGGSWAHFTGDGGGWCDGGGGGGGDGGGGGC